ncbi:MAG: glutathione peroxidase [Myxococcota bacterium]
MIENREGQAVPEVRFRARRDGDWNDIDSQNLFEGRTVVVFALPGAFTPTCSSTHLPRYEELAPALREAGVDEIACLSVNDGFVMEAWGKDQGVDRVTLLPDGNGDFSRALGTLVDKGELGFGDRSWRYSMLVRDGVIEKMFIEPEREGDPFEVSDADTMLAYLRPDAAEASSVSLFTRPGCGHCVRAKALLDDRGLRYEEIVLGSDVTGNTLKAVTGRTTVPQVFIDGKHIGGADELEAHLAA